MCLLVVASRVVAGEPLIVGANRDEVLERPSTAVTVLEEGPPRIVGGRDELVGGTWLAVNEHGVCAGLTNQPLGDAKDPSKRSRGELPLALARHDSGGGCRRGAPGGVPTGGLQRVVAARRRPHVALLRRLHRARATARRSTCRRGSTCWRTAHSASPRPRSTWCTRRSGPAAAATRWSDAFRRVLADHRNPEGDERPNAANCVHLEAFGTRSSCLVRVPCRQRSAPHVGGGRAAVHDRLRGRRAGSGRLPAR